MSKKLLYWEIAGVIFTVIIGTLLHFVYDWSSENQFAAIFSAVNESTWEHLKLLFYPALVFSIFEYLLIGKNYSNFIIAKALGIFLGLISIIVIFYTYTGIIGKNYLFMDILTFILGVIISFYSSYKIISSNLFTNKIFSFIGFLILVLLLICFIIFTFNPPEIELFLDPLTKTYGI